MIWHTIVQTCHAESCCIGIHSIHSKFIDVVNYPYEEYSTLTINLEKTWHPIHFLTIIHRCIFKIACPTCLYIVNASLENIEVLIMRKQLMFNVSKLLFSQAYTLARLSFASLKVFIQVLLENIGALSSAYEIKVISFILRLHLSFK